MNTFIRFSAGLALFGSLAAGLGAARPAWVARLGADWWSLPELQARMELSAREHDRLEATAAVVMRRIEERGRLMRELREGRLTLFEAAVGFGELNALPGAKGDFYRFAHLGSSDGEKLCRQVIAWVRCDPGSDVGPQSEEFVRRLEAELADHLRAHGTVVLPRAASAGSDGGNSANH